MSAERMVIEGWYCKVCKVWFEAIDGRSRCPACGMQGAEGEGL